MLTVDRRRFITCLSLGLGLAGCAQVEPGLPGLVVTGLRWSEDGGATWHTGPIQAGSDVLFEADVKNQGTGPTPAGVIIGVGFRANGVLVSWSDDHTSALPAGKTISLRANGGPDGDKYWNNAPAGNYTINALVDDINRIPNELDKTNNTLDVSVTVASPAQVVTTAWTGFNANTGFYTATGYVTACNNEIAALNGRAVRMGMDGVGGATSGAAFTWAARDAVVAAHRAAGLEIHCGFGAEFQVSKGASQAAWEANWRYFCANVFARYNNQIMYYILGNEPDLAGRYAYNVMIRFMQIAKEERDKVNPAIVLESDPVSSPNTPYLRNAINAGLTRYVDIVGVHNYGAQTNEGLLDMPWTWMKNANAARDYPLRPIASSESGCDTTWPHSSSWSDREAQAHWFALNRVQLKRYGYSNVLYYSINSTVPSNRFDVAAVLRTSPFTTTRFQPTFDTVRAISVDRGLRNAGFEQANNYDTDWVIYYVPDNTAAGPPEWNRVAYRTDGAHARTGSGYMRQTCGATNRVRQVVEGLTPGRQYTLTAFAKLSASGPTATLCALGFNHLDGQQQAAASDTAAGTYRQLQVTFTPSKTWVVISLESTGGSSSQFVYWDDVSIDAASV